MTIRSCPDNGTCHHQCEGRPCWRVQHCAPLSLAGFPGDQWPDDVKRDHGVEVPETCPFCGLTGHEAMIPDGSGLPRVTRGMQYDCGTTSIQQSRLCSQFAARHADLIEKVERYRQLRQHVRTDGRQKLGYQTEERALEAAQRMTEKAGVQYTHYRCPLERCGLYHVGHKRTRRMSP